MFVCVCARLRAVCVFKKPGPRRVLSTNVEILCKANSVCQSPFCLGPPVKGAVVREE